MTTYRRQVTPDMAVTVDDSQCVVLEVTNATGHVVRRVTVTNIDALKDALDDARTIYGEGS